MPGSFLQTDAAVFYSASDFAVPATIGAATVYVQFWGTHEIFDPGHGTVSTRNTRAELPTAWATGISRGSTLVIGSTTYYVTEIRTSSDGLHTILDLSKDA